MRIREHPFRSIYFKFTEARVEYNTFRFARRRRWASRHVAAATEPWMEHAYRSLIGSGVAAPTPFRSLDLFKAQDTSKFRWKRSDVVWRRSSGTSMDESGRIWTRVFQSLGPLTRDGYTIEAIVSVCVQVKSFKFLSWNRSTRSDISSRLNLKTISRRYRQDLARSREAHQAEARPLFALIIIDPPCQKLNE